MSYAVTAASTATHAATLACGLHSSFVRVSGLHSSFVRVSVLHSSFVRVSVLHSSFVRVSGLHSSFVRVSGLHSYFVRVSVLLSYFVRVSGLHSSFVRVSGLHSSFSSTRTMFQCTWPDCRELAESCSAIESHIRVTHLGLSARRRSRSLSSLHSSSDSDSEDDHEEDFYWTEVEVAVATNVDPTTLNCVVSNRPPQTSVIHQGSVSPVLVTTNSPSPLSYSTVICSGQQTNISAMKNPAIKSTSIITMSNPLVKYTLGSPNGQSAAATTLLTFRADSASHAKGSTPLRITSPVSPSHHTVIHRTPASSPLGSGGPRTNLSTHPYLQGGGWTSSPRASLSKSPSVGPSTVSSVLKFSGGQYVQVSSPPTLSHMDMARPPHEDPEYRRRLTGSSLLSSSCDGASYLTCSNEALGAGGGKVRVTSSPKASPGRGGKRGGESKKCRKYYGMEQKNEWCTQCRWKKACSRFVNSS
ncbi:uncharacterized protein LOC108669623 [Hyalella azteca]|uniref:Uncharacterized protein LOC108669623 n=1 Tax=Hyalella azteca TaxID=294128 RepID=A0A8B7NFT9_HYAAZ|nr:uncharacterized protein LOC108669623 [Hyalella azteca]